MTATEWIIIAVVALVVILVLIRLIGGEGAFWTILGGIGEGIGDFGDDD